MDDTGTVSVTNDASVAAPPADTVTDTAIVAEPTPDYAKLVDEVERNWDKIPADTRRRLDKNFQPAFNRSLNLLNDSVTRAVTNAGIPVPDGKTPLDLLTENEGKGFMDALRSVVASEVEPVKSKIMQAETSQTLNTAINRAVQANPDIKPYVEESIAEIDQNADLTKIAMMGNGNGLFYVLQGVAERRARLAEQARNRELTQLLEANKIAIKTGPGTSKAGAGAPKTQAPARARTLAEAAAFALEKVKAELNEV